MTLAPPLELVWTRGVGRGIASGWCTGGGERVLVCGGGDRLLALAVNNGRLLWERTYPRDSPLWYCGEIALGWDKRDRMVAITTCDGDETMVAGPQRGGTLSADWVLGVHRDVALCQVCTIDLRALTSQRREVPVRAGVTSGARFFADTGRAGSSALGCVDLDTGATAWTCPQRGTRSELAPLALDGDVAITKDHAMLRGWAASDGRALWALPYAASRPPPFDVAMHAGLVFVLQQPARGALHLSAVDAGSGAVRWSEPAPDASTPIVTGSVVWLTEGETRDDCRLVARDAASGRALWHEQLDPSAAVQAVIDEHVLVLTGGVLRCYRPAR